MKPCTKPSSTIGVVDKYLGTSYDKVKFVYDNIDDIRIVAEHLNLTTGPQGDVGPLPNVTDNGDGTYTITGSSGDVVISKGDSGDIRYQDYEYSTDGTAYHSPVTTDDYWRRERLVTIDSDNNTTNGSWSTGIIFRVDGVTPVKGIDYFDGRDAVYRANVYSNSIMTTIPAAPTGGVYDGTNHVPPSGWVVAPVSPSSGDSTWVSIVEYKNQQDGSWIAGTWSTPSRYSGEIGSSPQKNIDYFDGKSGAFTSLIFMNGSTAPTAPSGGLYNGTTETIPTGWSDDPTTPTEGIYVWVSKTTWTSDDNGNWDNSGWTAPSKHSGDDGYTPIKGEDYTDGLSGKFTTYIFHNAENQPSVPLGGEYTGSVESFPTDWSDNPSTPSGGQSTWVSKAVYSPNTDGTFSKTVWSNPSRFSGEEGYTPQLGTDYFNGAKGDGGIDGININGDFISYVFRNASVKPATPIGGNWDGTTESFPSGWTDDPASPETGEFTWVATTAYKHDGSIWSSPDWSEPSQFSGHSGYTPIKGVDYYDGNSGAYSTFIFKNEASRPSIPVGGAYTGIAETIPFGWSDEAELATGNDAVWVSKTVYDNINGAWVARGWSNPVIFSSGDIVISAEDTVYNDQEIVIGLVNDIFENYQVGADVFTEEKVRITETTAINAQIGQAQADIITTNQLIVSGDEAIATQFTEVNAKLDSSVANAVAITQSIANLDSATTTQFDGLQALVDGNTSEIVVAKQAQTTADTAQALLITGLSTRVTTTENDAVTLSGRVTVSEAGISTNQTAISDEATSRASETTALSSRLDTTETDITGLTTRTTAAEAGIVTNASTIVTNETARVQDSTALVARVVINENVIGDETTAGTILKRIVDSEASIITNATAITTEESSRATQYNGLNTRLTTTETAIGDASTDGSMLKRITDSETNIATNATGISDSDSARATELSITNARFTTVELDATNLTTRVTTTEAGIVTNTTAIATTDSTVATMNTTLTASIGVVGAKADTSLIDAQNAQNTADSAQTDATSATNTANNAANIANLADAASWNAQLSANSAISKADTAQATANGAASAASGAQATANSADSTASAAYGVATLADSTANTAISRAYLQTSVGTGGHQRIAGITVENNGSTSKLEFQSDTVRFIDSNGQWRLAYDTSNDRWLFSGYLSAATGTFTGSLSAATGSFAGSVFTSGWYSAAIVQAYNTGSGASFSGTTNGTVCVLGSGGSQTCADFSNSDGGYGVRASASGTYAYYSSSGAGTGAGTGYGPFTGAHDGFFPKGYRKVDVGDILVDSGVVFRNGISDTICNLEISSKPNQRNASGIFVIRSRIKGERKIAAIPKLNREIIKKYDAVIMNSLGEGQMNVCGEGGDIEAGDLITTSSIAGKGMKQLDQDNFKPYTVAQSRETITFESATEIKQIAVFYKCG